MEHVLIFFLGAGLDREPRGSVPEQAHRCGEISASGQSFAETS